MFSCIISLLFAAYVSCLVSELFVQPGFGLDEDFESARRRPCGRERWTQLAPVMPGPGGDFVASARVGLQWFGGRRAVGELGEADGVGVETASDSDSQGSQANDY